MNLLDQKISEKIWKISSDCVQDDHYLLENLIASDEAKRRIGFMAFPVSKPPISIQIECELKIDISCIRICSVLDSLKSTKFQIMAEFSEQNHHKQKTIADISLESEFNGFCIKTSESLHPHEGSLKEIVLENHLDKYIKNLNKLIIIIKDTNLKRSPVIKKLEIYGNFSASNNQGNIQEITSILNAKPEQSTSTKLQDVPPKPNDPDTFQIPEEFLDAITHEILNQPYILPSGSIVDLTTLEKHKRNEAIYGRYPSDPFTGVAFTASIQPKFDAALKVRLDSFKLRYSDEIEIKNSGRSVGRKEKLCEPSTSRQFNNHVSKKIKLNQQSSLDEIIKSIYRNKQISSFTNPQQQVTENCCLKCKLKDGANLYKISVCGHIFCKKCVLDSNSICSICSNQFENKHVERLNV